MIVSDVEDVRRFDAEYWHWLDTWYRKKWRTSTFWLFDKKSWRKERKHFDFRWKKTKSLNSENKRFWQWTIAETKRSKSKICKRDSINSDISVESLNNFTKCRTIQKSLDWIKRQWIRTVSNMSLAVIDFNRWRSKSIDNYLLYEWFADLDKQFQVKIIWNV